MQFHRLSFIFVTSLAEVWIEINSARLHIRNIPSLPLRKCGMKFVRRFPQHFPLLSLPLRKCGLKCPLNILWSRISVTSLAEVWIEMSEGNYVSKEKYVTSLAEVWIEMLQNWQVPETLPSLPLRKCGLK